MDMIAACISSGKANILLAETTIVYDRLHIMKLATEAVDNVRRAEHKQLQAQGNDWLKCSRYLWFSGQEK